MTPNEPSPIFLPAKAGLSTSTIAESEPGLDVPTRKCTPTMFAVDEDDCAISRVSDCRCCLVALAKDEWFGAGSLGFNRPSNFDPGWAGLEIVVQSL